jgi:hypothetical protein
LNLSSFTGIDGQIYCEDHKSLSLGQPSNSSSFSEINIYFSDEYSSDLKRGQVKNPKTQSLAAKLLAQAVKKKSRSMSHSRDEKTPSARRKD